MEKKEKKKRAGGRAACTVAIIRVYENLWTIEGLEGSGCEREGPAVCVCSVALFP